VFLSRCTLLPVSQMLIQWHELQEDGNGLGLGAYFNSINLKTNVHVYDDFFVF